MSEPRLNKFIQIFVIPPGDDVGETVYALDAEGVIWYRTWGGDRAWAKVPPAPLTKWCAE